MKMNVTFEGDNINGIVLDNETGQPLSGASVVLDGTNVGSVTNPGGEFSISKENVDASRLIISFIGYTSTSINLDDPLSMD